jgi:hypothetical protein
VTNAGPAYLPKRLQFLKPKSFAICSHLPQLVKILLVDNADGDLFRMGAGSSGDIARRDDHWSESIAVGREGFVGEVKNELGLRAQNRQDGLYTLREPVPLYGDHFDRKMRF